MIHFALAAWSNTHFQNNLYPWGTPASEQLPRYAKAFSAVEVSRFFHNVPPEEEMQEWRAKAPNLHFLAKAPRAVTHGKKSPETIALWEQFQSKIECLTPSKYLLQFQSNFRNKPENQAWLENVLGPNVAVEFRHDSWYTQQTRDLLTDHKSALAWHTYPGAEAPHWETTDWGYLRFVGNNIPARGEKPQFQARSIPTMAPPWKETYCVITNPFEGNALRSIPRVAKMLGETVDLGACHRDLGQGTLF